MAEHGHGEEHHGGGPGFYLLIALVLGVITFIEFAIIQWPQAWLSTTMVVLTLIVLSVVKFLLVIAYFMHLRDDENTYSGFFGSGMVIALGTFVVLTFLFTVPSVANALRGGGAIEVEAGAAEHAAETAQAEDAAHGGGGHGGVSEEVLASIASNGYSRETTAILDSPPPKNLGLSLTPPPLSTEVAYTLEPAPPFGSAAPEQPTPEQPAPGGEVEAQAPEPAEFDAELGLEIYNRNCVGCHQGGGRGIPGAFPPLAGHLPDVLAAEGGRVYLIDALLYGVQGQITIDGQNYNGVMPAWSQLDDAAVAAVLNHELTDWGNAALLEDFSPIGADEVAAERGKGLSPADVYELRNALELP